MFGAGTLGWQRSDAVDEFTGCAVRFFQLLAVAMDGKQLSLPFEFPQFLDERQTQ